MNKKFLLYTTLTAALCITGCTNVATFDYAEAPGPMVRLQEKGAGKKTIAVLPFMDQRGTKYFDPMPDRPPRTRPEITGRFIWDSFLCCPPDSSKRKNRKTARILSLWADSFSIRHRI